MFQVDSISLLKKVKPPKAPQTRHQTPAPTSVSEQQNNFRLQTAKGIRSSAFIHFSSGQLSTNATNSHVQIRAKVL